VGSDAGATWQGDVPPPTEPPPTPYERGPAAAPVAGADPATPAAAPGATPGSGPVPAPAPRRRRWRAVLVVAAAVALVVTGAVLLTGWSDDAGAPAGTGATDPDADAVADPSTDAALLALLEAVDASELVMLGFDEAAGAAFADAASQDRALALVRSAAAEAVAELRRGRAGLVEPLGPALAEDVRAAYVPHLDAWVDYLAAIAEDPRVALGEGSEPLILRINATAGVFAAALEGAVGAGVGPEVAEAARDILERGFPDQDDASL
jgi:hypothetical protein